MGKTGFKTKKDIKDYMNVSSTTFYRYWTEKRVEEIGMKMNEWKHSKLIPIDVYARAILLVSTGSTWVPPDGIYIENLSGDKYVTIDRNIEDRQVTIALLKGGVKTENTMRIPFFTFKKGFSIVKFKE